MRNTRRLQQRWDDNIKRIRGLNWNQTRQAALEGNKGSLYPQMANGECLEEEVTNW